jgi:small subunit ribosomal protein S20
MPNTKSAAKRARSTARRATRNKLVKSRVKMLEKKFLEAVDGGKADQAKHAYIRVISAYDRAAKRGVLRREKSNRKKSRLQLRLNALAAKPA